MNLGLVVEFFGQPGAGKTYLCADLGPRLDNSLALRDMLSPKRYSREWLRSRVGSFRWMVLNPRYTLQLWSAIAATGQASSRDVRRFHRGWIRTIERIGRLRRHNDYLLVDHGMAQLLWSIGYGAEPSRWSQSLPHFRRLMRLADLTVILTISTDNANARLERRAAMIGATSRVQLDATQFANVDKRVAALTSQLQQFLMSLQSDAHAVVEVDNSDRSEICEPLLLLIRETRLSRE